MTPRTTRLLRGGLLGVLVAVTGAVVWTSRRAPTPAAPPSTLAPPAREGTRVGAFVHRVFKGDKERMVIRAESFEGKEQEDQKLRGVEVTIAYVAKGKEGRAVVTADEAVHSASIQKTVFRGHVRVTTEDGLELLTDELVYRADRELARSDAAVAFKRKDLSGTAKGFSYEAEAGKLELLADVALRVQDEGNPATDITSRRAEASRDEGLMRFLGTVEVRHSGDRLVADRLIVNFNEDDRAIFRAQAIDGVQVWTGSGTAVPGLPAGATAGRGPRHLACRKLDLWFRPDKTLQHAIAGPDADLTMMPGPGEVKERRRLKSDVLTFLFDEEGRLEELQTLKDTAFTAEPLPPSKAPGQAMTCKRFLARVDPPTGSIHSIEFLKDVEFVRGSQKARAQKALFQGAKSLLGLSEEPVMLDEEQKTELHADVIELHTGTGDVRADQRVQHVLRGRGAQRGLLGSDEDPTQVTASEFTYTAKDKLAYYGRGALLRAGKDEVRAGEIRIQELPGGKRRLKADARVVAQMQPKGDGKGRTQPKVEARAAEMVYDEAENRIVYRGDVVIRQGDIQTKSPQAVLALTPDGGSVRTLEVGEPVEVQQASRRASGAKGTYSPDDGTMVLVGETVVLTDPSGRVEGRSLTFHVGDDRILVDGREEVRTQMILRQQKLP